MKYKSISEVSVEEITALQAAGNSWVYLDDETNELCGGGPIKGEAEYIAVRSAHIKPLLVQKQGFYTVQIDHNYDVGTSGLFARRLWQVLFDEVYEKYCDLRWMHDFLCDLKIFEEYHLKTYESKDFKQTFWWNWHKSGRTDVTDYQPAEDEFVRVDIDLNTYITTLTIYPRVA